MQLSKNLTLAQMTKSNKATELNILNVPSKSNIKHMSIMATNIWQPLFDKFEADLFISSGFRNLQLNRALNGSKSSQHMKGQAMDIHSKSIKMSYNIYKWIKENLDFDQLIWVSKKGFFHVSFKIKGNRRQAWEV